MPESKDKYHTDQYTDEMNFLKESIKTIRFMCDNTLRTVAIIEEILAAHADKIEFPRR